MAGLPRRPGVRYPVLTPNRRGFDRAVAAGADEVAVFVSATETFAQRNLNTTLDGAIAMAGPVIDGARGAGLRVRGYVSMAFGDPWEGRVDPERTAAVTARLFALGCATVSLGDTIGVATPGQVQVVLQTVAAAGVPLGQVALHLHDTYGQALANVLAGLEAGVTEFDASAGGVGGCPFAESATGNLATEDLVWMLDGLGIEHGLDLAALVRTSRLAGRAPRSALAVPGRGRAGARRPAYGSRPMNASSRVCTSASSGTAPAARTGRWTAAARRSAPCPPAARRRAPGPGSRPVRWPAPGPRCA